MSGYIHKNTWLYEKLPIFKAPDLDITRGYITVTQTSQQPQTQPVKTRAELFTELEGTALKWWAYSWSSLKAAPEEKVSLDDLVFLTVFINDFTKYYAPETDGHLYFMGQKSALFCFEVIEFIVQGFDPQQAIIKAKQSVVNESFSNREPVAIAINRLSQEEKNKIIADHPGEQVTGGKVPSGTTTTPDAPGNTEKKSNTGLLLIAVILILIMRKK